MNQYRLSIPNTWEASENLFRMTAAHTLEASIALKTVYSLHETYMDPKKILLIKMITCMHKLSSIM